MKKKLLLTLLAVILSILPTYVNAATLINGINYNLNYSSLTAEVISKSSGKYTFTVNIPATVVYNGRTYSVTSIGHWAFDGCSGLTSVTIPNSVTSIGNSAFYNCSGLTSVTIPNSVNYIGMNAFYGCYGLTSVHISDLAAWCNISFEISNSNPLSYAHHLYLNGTEVTDLVIPNNVTSIGDRAFLDCSGLTSVTIPNSVTSIGNSAFSSCSNITDFYCLGETVPTTASDAFYNLNISNTTLHVLLSAVESYSNTAPWNGFGNIVVLVEETPISFADMEVRALCMANWDTDGNGTLTYKEAAAVTDLELVFTNNTDITSFNELQYFTGLTSIGSGAFEGCSELTSVTIPNSVTYIGTEAFQYCSGLTSVTIGNSVTSIGQYAFYGCSGLTSVTIPNSVTSIGKSAFQGLRRLTSVTIGNSVTSIGTGAFQGCVGLTSITIPNSVTSIGEHAFSSCVGLTSVHISDLAAWCNISFYNYYSSPLNYAAHLYLNGTEVTDLVIPNSVTSIRDYAFCGCSGLTSVTIPNSVTSIGQYAFNDCSGLTSVTIPNSVTSIGDYAFCGCRGLTSVNIPNSVTSIGQSAFSGCSRLTKVKVEKSSPLSISSYTFRNSNCANATLYVPKGSKSSYSSADYWKEFKTIKEFPSTDVNGDNKTNVVDVVDIARFVVGTPRSEFFEEFLADLDGSREVNVADAIVLVNDIAGDTNWAKPMMAMSRTTAKDVLKLVSTDGNNLSLQMDGNGQYAAFQFDLWLPEGVDVMEMALNNERRQGHQLLYNKVSEGHYRVVALSTAANSFNGTSGELLDMTLDGFATDDIRVDDIRFVTPDGGERQFDALSVTRNGITTSIDGRNSYDNCDKRTVYNLNGQRMNSPQKGLNIINGRKVVIK